jgi:hypothetical protein
LHVANEDTGFAASQPHHADLALAMDATFTNKKKGYDWVEVGSGMERSGW